MFGLFNLPWWAAGRVRVIQAESAAGVATIDVDAGNNGKWLVLALWGAHTDDVNRDLFWTITDSTASLSAIPASSTVAANVVRSIWSLSATDPLALQWSGLVLSPTVKATLTATSLASPHTVYYRGIVIDLQGLEADSG